jgi:hypothetical protein
MKASSKKRRLKVQLSYQANRKLKASASTGLILSLVQSGGSVTSKKKPKSQEIQKRDCVD